MGQLVMAFYGICMHLDRSTVPFLSISHRVVAVNADAGYESKAFGPLPPHRVFLMMDEDFAERFVQAGVPRDEQGNFPLTGARVEVANATGEPLAAFIDKIPQLTTFAPKMELRGELAGEAVPETADSFVEMTHGQTEANQFAKGGIYSTWTVQTDDDPVIRITMTGKVFTVPVPSTPEGKISIALKNGTTDSSDKKFDFALHYLAAVGGIDKQWFMKEFPTDSDIDRSIGVDTTTSCSNSQYP